MTDDLEKHHNTVSTGGWVIINLQFADDIDRLAGEEQELASLVNLSIRHARHGHKRGTAEENTSSRNEML